VIVLFEGFVDRVRDMMDGQDEKIADEASKRLMEIIEKEFINEGHPSHKWAPLSPITIRIKKKKGYPKPEQILEATGKLRGSVERNQIDKNTYEVIIDDDKAAYHEYGTAHMPARPILRPAVQQLKREYPDLQIVSTSGGVLI